MEHEPAVFRNRYIRSSALWLSDRHHAEKSSDAASFFPGYHTLLYRLPTLRAGKGASPGKVDPDVESLCIGVKLCIRHLPRRCQTKGHLKKVYVSHNENVNIILAVSKSMVTHLK